MRRGLGLTDYQMPAEMFQPELVQEQRVAENIGDIPGTIRLSSEEVELWTNTPQYSYQPGSPAFLSAAEYFSFSSGEKRPMPINSLARK